MTHCSNRSEKEAYRPVTRENAGSGSKPEVVNNHFHGGSEKDGYASSRLALE